MLPILLLLSAVGVCAVAVLAREGVYLPNVAEDLRDVVRALGVVLAVRNVQVALANVVLHPVAVDAVLKRGIRIYEGNESDICPLKKIFSAHLVANRDGRKGDLRTRSAN